MWFAIEECQTSLIVLPHQFPTIRTHGEAKELRVARGNYLNRPSRCEINFQEFVRGAAQPLTNQRLGIWKNDGAIRSFVKTAPANIPCLEVPSVKAVILFKRYERASIVTA